MWLQQQQGDGRQTQWRPASSQPAQPTCGQERGTADCDSGRRFSHAPSGSGSGSCGSSGGSSALLHNQGIGPNDREVKFANGCCNAAGLPATSAGENAQGAAPAPAGGAPGNLQRAGIGEAQELGQLNRLQSGKGGRRCIWASTRCSARQSKGMHYYCFSCCLESHAVLLSLTTAVCCRRTCHSRSTRLRAEPTKPSACSSVRGG